MLRDWRIRRRRSQMELALDVGVSTRHLSFVETGRSRPSPDLVVALARHLDVPLRERNVLLLAAGYAPRYAERTLDDERMAVVRASLQRMLDAHHPYPGVVIDRQWNVALANGAAATMLSGVPAALREPANIYRVSLHPDALAALTLNFGDWAAYLVQQLRRSVQATADASLQALLDEVLAYPNVARVRPLIDMAEWDEPPLLVPLRLASPLGELSLFTTITTFGTPLDVTLDELSVELFYPANDASADVLRRLDAAVTDARGR
jgi:transcriptional regulator with XRE-family HTH domain